MPATSPGCRQVAVFDNGDTSGVAEWLAAALPDAGPAAPLAFGVNVAGAERQHQWDMLFARHGIGIHWQSAQAQTGPLANGYREPTRLGADRWAALVGVSTRHHHLDAPFVLASFGTATTVDIVGPDQRFHGGLILPGATMMRQALSTGTADLPWVEPGSTLFPVDTQQAIATGVAAAQAGAVWRQVLAAFERFDAMPQVYVTGGAWLEVEAETRRLLHAWPQSSRQAPLSLTFLDQPVLDGLAAMAALHRRQE